MTDPERLRFSIHGNGFLQVHVEGDRSRRVHVWHQSIPRQTVYTGVHNHRFGFKSKVLFGTMRHKKYDIVPDLAGSFCRYRVDGRALVDDGVRIAVDLTANDLYSTGTEYAFPPGAWHETLAESEALVTLFEKTEVTEQPVYVAVPFGQLPDNDFLNQGIEFDVTSLPDDVLNCILSAALS